MGALSFESCGGAFSDPNSFGCSHPAWSPDGQKIIFARFSAATGDRDIFTVNADGSGLSQITDTPSLSEGLPDWGIHPVRPMIQWPGPLGGAFSPSGRVSREGKYDLRRAPACGPPTRESSSRPVGWTWRASSRSSLRPP
jgi:WD40-like Beta Propeller Repeat